MPRTAIALCVAVLAWALLAVGEDEGACYESIAGGDGRLPCYVFGSPPMSGAEINLGAPRGQGLIRDVVIPVADSYYEGHGWLLPEDCVHLSQMNASAIADYVQSHGSVEISINGQPISPSFVSVVPMALGELFASPGAPGWLLGWWFEYPQDLIRPGVYVTVLTYNWDQPVFECGSLEGQPIFTGSKISTVTVLYEQ